MRIKTISKVAMVVALIAIAIFALGIPAFASTKISGPTPPKLGDPVVGSLNEINRITISFTNGGDFRLKVQVGSGTATVTGTIAWNTDAAGIDSALEALSNIGAGNVTVTGGGPASADPPPTVRGIPFEVTFGGALAALDITMSAVKDAAGTQSGNNLTSSDPLYTPSLSVSTRQDGYTFPTGRAPDVSPHGGYSSSTNFCLQCHSVHPTSSPLDPNEGAYALLWKSNVTSTCQTCHGIGGASAGGTRDTNTLVGSTGLTIATTSLRTAYDVTTGLKASHPLNATDSGLLDNVTIMDTGWEYGGFNAAAWAANRQADGLQCTSCHTPHGDFGRLINSPTGVVRSSALPGGDYSTLDMTQLETAQTFAEGRAIFFGSEFATGEPAVRYLHLDTDYAATPVTPNQSIWLACKNGAVEPVADGLDTVGVGGPVCEYLQVIDADGQLVSLFGYKLLTAFPNHDYLGDTLRGGAGGGESWGLDARTRDQTGWCGTCHPTKVSVLFGGTYHNHPTGCTSCHGNPTNDTTSRDFPHTSTFGSFLTSYPDALCIRCHTAGALP